jgi:prepilin-type N-terminal cleavage/methylation domain-containing protein
MGMSTVMFRTFSRQHSRGFTLTEIAVVLGIISVILGAIWVAAATVYANLQTETAVRDVMQISQGMHDYFKNGTMPITGANWDLTQQLISANVIPQDIVSRPCADTTAVYGASPCPLHPWGEALLVGSQSPWGGSSPVGRVINNRRFEVLFRFAVTEKKNCSPLIARIVAAATSNHLTWIYSDGFGTIPITALMSPLDPIFAHCAGNLVFQFQL